MDIRINGCGSNAVLELPTYSVGQTKTHVPVRQISTYKLIDYNGNYGTEIMLVSGQRVLAGCWPEDLSMAITAATQIYETGDIAIPDEVVDLRLLLESRQECDRLRAEVEALKATCKQHLQVQRYELVYDEMQEDDEGDWVRWIDIESALRGEGE